MEFNITGYQLVAGMAVVCLAIIVIIYVSRWYLNRKLKTNTSSKPSERTKYKAYDVLRNTGVYFRIGLVGALTLTLLAFNWTSYEPKESFEFTFIPDEDLETIPPVIHPPKPPAPKPPPPVIVEVPDNEITEAEEPVFVDPVVVDNTPPAPPAPPVPKPPVAPTPPPLPEVEKQPEFVVIAQEMPRICTSCETKALSRSEKNKCAGNEMLKFVQSKVQYPSLAREVGVEGVVAVRFRINPDGSLSHVELLKDIGAGCGKEALRATKLLQEQCWLPGKQNGRPVAVQMTLPIRFRLQN